MGAQALEEFLQISVYPVLRAPLGKLAYPVSFSGSILAFSALSWYLGLLRLPVSLAALPFLGLLLWAIGRKRYSREDLKQQEQQQQIAQERKSQVGTGDRSERIRTYNYPQGRVTDHRIGLTLYRLEAMLDGDLEELLQGLIAYHRTRALTQA